MERWVCARRTVTGDPSRLTTVVINALPELLQAATDVPIDPPAGDGSINARLMARAAGVSLHKTVRVHIGQAEHRDSRVVIPIRWEAEPGKHVFPSFEGSVEVEGLSSAMVELTLVGRSTPPLGAVGMAVHVGSPVDVAQRTGQWLVDRLARALSDAVYGSAPPARPRVGSMTVSDVMTRNALVLTQDLSLRAAAALLFRGGISGAAVVDDHGIVVGVLSERDLLDKAALEAHTIGRQAESARRRHAAMTVGQACSRPAVTTEADATVRAAAREMARRDLDRLIVMDGAEHVGIVTRSDTLKALIRADDEVAAAVMEVLEDRDQHEVTVDVRDGVVSLGGKVRLRSQTWLTTERVAEVDGALDVVSHLTWQTDDVVPPVVPIM